eukprot:CAMPEP_0114539128 /NCGR_PEP_ID=MMETSP0114-20121206/74_1 /TAXON_ID=31324 /ORGANISM="Goniomonas sp, Strain m" /LENGTH=132 /DNA_ID=CAMNT_0001723213 /DNA_START=140 /DNA_END=538 /DNA_ORIENTATION=+
MAAKNKHQELPPPGPENMYDTRPTFRNKFKPMKAKKIIEDVLHEKLRDQKYSVELAAQMTREIAEDCKTKLKELNLQRYKFVVQVVFGEQRGEGVKMGCRCFWDQDCDNFATATFMNDSLFCVAAAWGVYLS